MTTDFRELLQVLTRARVEFIIVGGAAAIAHGSAKLTEDLDIVYRRTEDNIERIVSALAPHHPYLRGAPLGLPFDWSVPTIQNGLNLTLITSLGAIDLLGEITGGGRYEDLRSHSHDIRLYGTECLCLDLETLIKVKRAAGRPRDLDAVAELEALLEESR